MNPRAVAAQVIYDVVHNELKLNQAIPRHIAKLSNPSDQPLVQELSFGVLRYWFLLDETSRGLLQKPLKQKDFEIHCLLLVGLYQLSFTRIPAHAAVSETVVAVRQLKKAWADKLLNAVLRRYLREQKSATGENLSLQAQFSHPQWFINKLQKVWPQHWRMILQANNQRPPMTLRVNCLKSDRGKYLKQLTESGLTAKAALHTDSGIILDQPVNVEALPGFAEGFVSVQDSAAQLAAQLMDLLPGQRVLDVCAAPGGKTAHILETQPQLEELLAVDVDSSRLPRIEENLKRLNLNARLVKADASDVQQWWDGTAFDRILLDAPCSATGVIRRHPDIKMLRTAEDIVRVTQLQQQILDSVWPLLRVGGMLLYVTCSILPEENEHQVAAFVERHKNAYHQDLGVSWGQKRPFGQQIFPGEDDMDGFYYACMVKSG